MREEENELVFVFFHCFFSRKLFFDKICASHYGLAVLNNYKMFVSLDKLLHAPSIRSNVNKITQICWECRRDKSAYWWNIPSAKRRKLQVRIEVIKDRENAVLLLWENTSSERKKKYPLKLNILNERENQGWKAFQES